jgi:prepilin-type N-terminal cleavage/methylation domain-containing protein
MEETRHNLNNNESGFTLVEVLASLVIITIVITGVLNLLVFTNKTAVHNNDKLVAINLSKATIERMKIQPDAYFNLPNESTNYLYREITYNKDNCVTVDCDDLYQMTINDRTYHISVTIKQNDNDLKLGLVDVLVKAALPDQYIKSEVEGYMSYESK